MGLGAPFKAREALPGPSVGSQREEWGRDPPQTQSPVSNVPTTGCGDTAGGRVRQGWGLALSGAVCVRVWVRGRWKPRPKGTAPHAGLGAPQRLVCCVVWQRGRGWVVVARGKRGPGGGGGGGGSGAELSSPRRKIAPRPRSRRHVAVTAPPQRTPARCPLLPPSPARQEAGRAVSRSARPAPRPPLVVLGGGGTGQEGPHPSLGSLALQKGDESGLSV